MDIAGIPVSRGGIIGDTRGYLNRHSVYLKELQREHGDVFYFRTLFRQNLMVLDPVAIHRVFNEKGVSDKDFDFYHTVQANLGDGIISIGSNPDWLVRRRKMNNAYKPEGSKESMAFYKLEILDETTNLINEWLTRGENFVIDPIVEIQSFAIKVISRIMFGRDIVDGIWSLPEHISNMIRTLLIREMLGCKAANLINGRRVKASTAVVCKAIN